MSFKKWMTEVDRLCIKVTDLSTSDFEDHSWRSNYEDELTPGEALFYFFEETGHLRRYPELFSQYIEKSEII